MPSLGASGSVFQLAVAVNAIFPILISDFEVTRQRVGESIEKALLLHFPDLKISETERDFFYDFCMRTSWALRKVRTVTRIMVVVAAILSLVSLGALCWASISPNDCISIKSFFSYVGVTLILAPCLYLFKNSLLRRIYAATTKQTFPSKEKAEVFLECFRSVRDIEERTRVFQESLLKAQMSVSNAVWLARITRIRGRWIRFRGKSGTF